MTRLLVLLAVVVLIAAAGVVVRVLERRSIKDSGIVTTEHRLVLFTSPACPTCTAQARILDLLEPGERNRIDVIDVTTDPARAAAWRIKSLPALAVMATDGSVERVLTGVQSLATLRRLLRRAPIRVS